MLLYGQYLIDRSLICTASSVKPELWFRELRSGLQTVRLTPLKATKNDSEGSRRP